MIPEWVMLAIVAAFGLVIGSFLNVVIYRFHTGRSLNSRSHCLSCGRILAWYELFPVLSYLALRGRCQSCQSYIPYRYLLVEIMTAVAFVLVYFYAGDFVILALNLALLSVLIVVLVYDLYHLIIPDELSIAVALLAIIITGYFSWLVGSWQVLIFGLISGFLAALLLALVWYFSGGRAIGLGDAKLSFGLGAMVSLSGLFSFIVWAFWLGAVVGVGLILVSTLSTRLSKWVGFKIRPRVNMKSELPFAPFLIASFLLVYFIGADILLITERILFGLL